MRQYDSFTKRLLRLLLCLVMVMGLLPMFAAAATTDIAEPAKTSNISDLNYTYDRWANPVNSYLFDNGDGTLTRVEYTGEAVTIECYDSSFQFISGSTLAMELPLFGGFYRGTDSNFLVFGQENPNEDDSVEVIRVVRYTTDWERVGSASLYGANTVIPFASGSLRFTEYNGYLYIRTCHKMYASSDGLNHQSNLTMNVRISDMTVTDSCYVVASKNRGYVSHSFNQFITVADGKVVAVDHGDAYPRSVLLTRYLTTAGQDLFLKDKGVTSDGYVKYVDTLDVLSIAGDIGNNDTGVSLGGFETSDSHYLIAGNTISHGEDYDLEGQRNIFVSATATDNFTTEGTTIHYLTSYAADAAVTLDNPQFAKIDQNRYVVLWKETSGDTSVMRWAFVDGTGAPTGESYSGGGALSDCQPIVFDGKLVWYVTSSSAPAFMTIDLETPDTLTHQHVNTYSYVRYPSYTNPGSLSSVCAVCGAAGESAVIPAIQGCDEYTLASTKTAPTCTEDGYGYYKWSGLVNYDVKQYNFGGKIPALGHEYETVTVAASCAVDGSITDTCTRCGDVVVQVIPALGHDSGDVEVQPPTCTEAGGGDFTCVVCGEYISEALPATGHYYDNGVVTDPACDQQGYTTYTCTVCGDSYQDDFVEGPGHTWFINSMLPGCTSSGYSKYRCQVCDYSYQETLAPTGHNYEAIVTAPTCTEAGYTTYDCANENCKSVYTADEVPALGHNYIDAICTLCGEVDPDQTLVVPSLTLQYPTVTFEDMISMNVCFSMGNYKDVTGIGLIVYSSEVSEWNVDNAQRVIPGGSVTDAWDETKNLHVLSIGSIAAKDMGDTYWFAVYAQLEDGSYTYSRLVSYSPMDYAYDMLNSGEESFRQLMVALLNYGAAAQTFFDYRTDALMNAGLTDEQKSSIETYRADMMDSVSAVDTTKAGAFIRTSTGFTSRYPSISFEGAFKINYYCVPSAVPEEKITMYYWNQEDYDAAEVLTEENATAVVPMMKDTDIYRSAVTGIAAKNLDKGLYVAFVYSDGTTEYCSGILGYSIGAYCVDQASGDTAIAPFAQATAVYGYYAKQTFGA